MLTPGNYMRRTEVLDYLYYKICRPTLAGIVETYCNLESNEFGETYYVCNSLKNVMMPDYYRKMECHVTTFIV
jgi:hypothetical protein